MSIWYYICLHAFHQSYTVSFLLQGQRNLERPLWREEAEGSLFSAHLCLSQAKEILAPCDACGFSSKGLYWYRQFRLTAPGVHFCFLAQPPWKIWCHSIGQSNQTCPSWLVSPVVTWWTSGGGFLGVFLVVVFVWFCGFAWFWFLSVGWGRVVWWRVGGGFFVSFSSALRKINLWNVDFLLNLCIPLVCPFCWTSSSHFPGSSQYPLQRYIPGFCQSLLLQTAQNIALAYKHK